MTTNTATYCPKNRRKLLIMRWMPISCSVVSLRSAGVSTGNSAEAKKLPLPTAGFQDQAAARCHGIVTNATPIRDTPAPP